MSERFVPRGTRGSTCIYMYVHVLTRIVPYIQGTVRTTLGTVRTGGRTPPTPPGYMGTVQHIWYRPYYGHNKVVLRVNIAYYPVLPYHTLDYPYRAAPRRDGYNTFGTCRTAAASWCKARALREPYNTSSIELTYPLPPSVRVKYCSIFIGRRRCKSARIFRTDTRAPTRPATPP